MVCLAQTVHLSCTNNNTVSKWTKMRFYMTQVTLELHWVCPKRLLSLWYVWGKQFTGLASRLTLTPNRPKQGSTWATSPRSTIGCVQNESWAYSMFSAKPAPILQRHSHHLQMDRNEIRHDPRHLGVPSGASKMISDPMVRSMQTMHLSYTNTNQFQIDRNDIPQDPCYLKVPSGVSKTIYEPMVHLAQTMHLSCTDTNIISKWIETRFDTTRITQEFHRVHPKLFVNL
jgi:hypothetical protein